MHVYVDAFRTFVTRFQFSFVSSHFCSSVPQLVSRLAVKMASSGYMQFEIGVSIANRVAAIKPIINALVEEHEADESRVGVEAFQEDLMARIKAAGLMETKWANVDEVGVHPDNREQSMLVPIDVHDLLKRMSRDGWSYKKWEALSCEIPVGPIGEQWRKANEDLSKSSEGLLAPCQGDLLTMLTGRGSHGTAAVRAMKSGVVGIHQEICADGRVSQGKICEAQPSMMQPVEKGCPYDVLKAERVVACPRLMEVLSRTGNAGHSVFRVQTALQHCNRIHQLVVSRQKANKVLDWDVISKQVFVVVIAIVDISTTTITTTKILNYFHDYNNNYYYYYYDY